MRKLGWRPDLTDFRDLHHESNQITAITNMKTISATPATSANLTAWCSPVEDQGQLGSCTSFAAAGLIEYYERKALGKYLNASHLFIYKATRDLMKEKGDTGATLRDTMKALVLFGAPDETYWPYNINTFDNEPPAFIYSLAENYKALQYYRLDPVGTPLTTVLTTIKSKLLTNLPCMFGTSVYSSFPMNTATGDVPYPSKGDQLEGGHAMGIYGFDDNHAIGNCKGAFLIRNSWGTSWGNKGYGWLPYQYVLTGLASDFWCLIQASYIDTDLFK